MPKSEGWHKKLWPESNVATQAPPGHSRDDQGQERLGPWGSRRDLVHAGWSTGKVKNGLWFQGSLHQAALWEQGKQKGRHMEKQWLLKGEA